jgi:hypothetical protein
VASSALSTETLFRLCPGRLRGFAITDEAAAAVKLAALSLRGERIGWPKKRKEVADLTASPNGGSGFLSAA